MSTRGEGKWILRLGLVNIAKSIKFHYQFLFDVMIWPWRSNSVNKAALVYLNFCLTGALNCSIMTYYLTLLFSASLGKESPSRYNLLLLCLAKLFEWHSNFKRANYTASHNRHIRSQSLLVVLRISWLRLSFIREADFQCHFHFAAGDNLQHHTSPFTPPTPLPLPWFSHGVPAAEGCQPWLQLRELKPAAAIRTVGSAKAARTVAAPLRHSPC